MNYFHIFGLETQFNVDTDQLSQLYQALQKKVHPDRFAHASSQEQLIAVKKSTQINDAYQTLKDPLKRGFHLLELRGVDMPEEQATYNDSAFLMRQMELHEILAEMKHAEDVNAAIIDTAQILDRESDLLCQAMEKQLAENTVASNILACDNLRKLKFYRKLHLELDKFEDQLLDD